MEDAEGTDEEEADGSGLGYCGGTEASRSEPRRGFEVTAERTGGGPASKDHGRPGADGQRTKRLADATDAQNGAVARIIYRHCGGQRAQGAVQIGGAIVDGEGVVALVAIERKRAQARLEDGSTHSCADIRGDREVIGGGRAVADVESFLGRAEVERAGNRRAVGIIGGVVGEVTAHR